MRRHGAAAQKRFSERDVPDLIRDMFSREPFDLDQGLKVPGQQQPRRPFDAAMDCCATVIFYLEYIISKIARIVIHIVWLIF
jgi:hypothetical protein